MGCRKEALRKVDKNAVSGTSLMVPWFRLQFHPWLGNEDPAYLTAAAAKLLQSCPTLCNPIDGSPPGSPVPGIL